MIGKHAEIKIIGINLVDLSASANKFIRNESNQIQSFNKALSLYFDSKIAAIHMLNHPQ